MFDGNRHCSLCGRSVEEKGRNFMVSLSGFTYAFCRPCLDSKKDEIEEILHE